MVAFLYDIFVRLCGAMLPAVSRLSGGKTRLFYWGRRHLFDTMTSTLSDFQGETFWMHCASLGEFEQGRPVLEAIRAKFPQVRLVLTFFSPSGYEVQKQYTGVDHVFYLPLDTRSNVSRFLDLVRPSRVYFVKYEFWLNFLNELKKRNIPVFLFSALFRENQVFFRWYGFPFRDVLKAFRHIFVQDDHSRELLAGIGYHSVSVTGDTRFDRVQSIARHARSFPEIDRFVGDAFCLVAGSIWPADEALLARFINQNAFPVKYILAPHEIHPQHIDRLVRAISKPLACYSDIATSAVEECQVLIIDNVGMLSSLYRYAQTAYVGGGFGKEGIHNCLEPAVFGVPVLFGPNYTRYREAVSLVSRRGAFPVHDYEEFSRKLRTLILFREEREQAGTASSRFIASEIGATEQILQHSL